MCPIHQMRTQDHKQQLTNANINSLDGTSAFFIRRSPVGDLSVRLWTMVERYLCPIPPGDKAPSTVSPRPGNLATLSHTPPERPMAYPYPFSLYTRRLLPTTILSHDTNLMSMLSGDCCAKTPPVCIFLRNRSRNSGEIRLDIVVTAFTCNGPAGGRICTIPRRGVWWSSISSIHTGLFANKSYTLGPVETKRGLLCCDMHNLDFSQQGENLQQKNTNLSTYFDIFQSDMRWPE